MRLAGLFALASTRSRLATLLLAYEYLCFHPRHPVISRGALPALAAASREMTNRTLRDWEASGMIRRHGLRGLELRDPRRLAEEATLSGFHPFEPLNQARPVLEPVDGHRPDRPALAGAGEAG